MPNLVVALGYALVLAEGYAFKVLIPPLILALLMALFGTSVITSAHPAIANDLLLVGSLCNLAFVGLVKLEKATTFRPSKGMGSG